MSHAVQICNLTVGSAGKRAKQSNDACIKTGDNTFIEGDWPFVQHFITSRQFTNLCNGGGSELRPTGEQRRAWETVNCTALLLFLHATFLPRRAGARSLPLMAECQWAHGL
eukprot:52657-Amphidinium_carterae.1